MTNSGSYQNNIKLLYQIFLLHVFINTILALFLAPPPVFDCVKRTVPETGHAMGTGAFPSRAAVLHGDLIQRTEPGTFAAADASVRRIEWLCRLHVFFPKRIKRQSDQFFQQGYGPAPQPLSVSDLCRCEL